MVRYRKTRGIHCPVINLKKRFRGKLEFENILKEEKIYWACKNKNILDLDLDIQC